MKRLVWLPMSIIFLTVPAAGEEGTSPKAMTLADCYALALKQSEKVAIQQELITEAEARFGKAFGAVLPDATFHSSDKRQDGRSGSAFTLKEISERRFEFTQTLFHGFKEIAAMRASRFEKEQRTHEKARAEQILFLDVANAFYLLLEQQKDLNALRMTQRALVERIRELKGREKLGRSRPSEVASAKAKLSRIEAEIQLVHSRKVTAKQLLEFLTGLERIEAVADSEPEHMKFDSEGTYLGRADGRADVRAAQEAIHVAEKQVTIARAGYFPKLALEGNYYVEREGAAEGVDWDAAFTVDLPIFEGGQTRGAVKEASARERQAKLRLQEARRTASLDIRDVYARLQAAIARQTALEKALRATEEDYTLQVEDYRLSLVNNLDVLETLEDLQDARRDLIRAQYETKRLYWELKTAIGETL